MNEIGVNAWAYYFSTHGESNTIKTIELTRKRAQELGIKKIVIASETGLSALKAHEILKEFTIIVVSSAVGTGVKGSVIGDLKIGISEEDVYTALISKGVKIVRGTDPFWNLSANTQIIDTGKLGMMFYKVVSSGFHVCITAVIEATDAGYLAKGEEVAALAGSFVGLDTAIIATASNSVDFFSCFEVNEIICKPRDPRYSWPINQDDWRGDLKQYRRFTS